MQKMRLAFSVFRERGVAAQAFHRVGARAHGRTFGLASHLPRFLSARDNTAGAVHRVLRLVRVPSARQHIQNGHVSRGVRCDRYMRSDNARRQYNILRFGNNRIYADNRGDNKYRFPRVYAEIEVRHDLSAVRL